jgi:hypothetical protein
VAEQAQAGAALLVAYSGGETPGSPASVDRAVAALLDNPASSAAGRDDAAPLAAAWGQWLAGALQVSWDIINDGIGGSDIGLVDAASGATLAPFAVVERALTSGERQPASSATGMFREQLGR